MDPTITLRLLQSDADRTEIAARVAHSRDRGVTSVPTFILAHQHALQGAQPAEMWLTIIDELAEKLKDHGNGPLP
jgi:predicted DsbA family dithiol-disulfide isomerase